MDIAAPCMLPHNYLGVVSLIETMFLVSAVLLVGLTVAAAMVSMVTTV